RPFIGVPCHRRAADCCGENSTSKEEWNKELGTRHREQHNQRLLFTPREADKLCPAYSEPCARAIHHAERIEAKGRRLARKGYGLDALGAVMIVGEVIEYQVRPACAGQPWQERLNRERRRRWRG
ncbi:MAG: hypothetical protein V2A73_14315, partial [Pseudomonadota bacterium]